MSPKESSLAFDELHTTLNENQLQWDSLVNRKHIHQTLAFLRDSELDDQVVRIEGKITVSF